MKAMLTGLTASHESEHIYRGRYADRGVDDVAAGSQDVEPGLDGLGLGGAHDRTGHVELLRGADG